MISRVTERGCGEDLLGACYFQAMLLYSGLKPPGSAIHRDQIIRGLQNKDKTLIPEAAPKTPAQIEQHKVRVNAFVQRNSLARPICS